jgi:phosphoglycerol transferase MdoB-like AlkP superfamily enzyme
MTGKSSPGAGQRTLSFLRAHAWKFVAAYILLLVVVAFLGRWTPEFIQGRDLWHFTVSRMVVPMVMLGVVASFIRLVPASVLLAATFLFIGTISAIKREATGEPFQVSDLFLGGQSTHLLGYVAWHNWLIGATIAPALFYGLKSIRFRRWSIPLFAVCVALLSTYRLEPIVKLIHKHSYWIGVENLTFSQAESERMNGLPTHLYFSTAGLRLKIFTEAEVKLALAALETGPLPPPRTSPPPDIFIVLGEAWWRDPTDKNPPFQKLKASGFVEGTSISPVYGGTTPNAEFEVLTGIPIKSFQAGIIPYQHYIAYFTEAARSLPRLLTEKGYAAHAYHNFTPRFWLRDQIYPRFGFQSFDSMEQMKLTVQDNDWPTDEGLFNRVLDRLAGPTPQFHFIVTVETHGPYKQDKALDVVNGEPHPGITDYHNRLSSAVDTLLAFDAKLRARGKPYVLFVFGDHLPGLRLHQWKLGWKAADDPRLHQAPFLATSNVEDVRTLQAGLQDRPFTCIAPVMMEWLRLGIEDRYFRHMAKRCTANPPAPVMPSEAVIQNQLFSKQPQPFSLE